MPRQSEPPIDLCELEPVRETARLHRLYDYWQSKRCAGCLPSRPDIEPGKLIFILSNIYLIDVYSDLPPEEKYRFRLFGTALVELMGREFTGRTPHEVMDASAANSYLAFCDRVTNSREPVTVRGPALFSADWCTQQFEFCQMPLRDQSGRIAIHIGGLLPHEPG